MGLDQILEKINKEIQKNINNECQVVYILSRIRKFLEFKKIQNKYKHLNLYCNWVLHPKIDKTGHLKETLQNFIEHKDDDKFLFFEYLTDELKTFLKENDLSYKKLFETENYINFLNLLVDILSDTPLEVLLEEKKTITIKKIKRKLKNNPLFSVSYQIK